MAEIQGDVVASHDDDDNHGSNTMDHQANGRQPRQDKRKCSKSFCCCLTGAVLLVLSVLLVTGLGIVYYYSNQIFFYIANKVRSLLSLSLLFAM